MTFGLSTMKARQLTKELYRGKEHDPYNRQQKYAEVDREMGKEQLEVRLILRNPVRVLHRPCSHPVGPPQED